MKALPKIPERRCNKRFPVTGNPLAVAAGPLTSRQAAAHQQRRR